MKSEIADIICTYYSKEQRDLPWRNKRTPYTVWISEIMLQQTKVETVKGYYEAFLNAFPDVFALASAKEEEVLKLWEGLGYYSRARNLKKAAEIIVLKYEGEFPKTKEELCALPGIGEYTGNAVSCFCFDAKEIPIDGNFLRVYARLTSYEEDVLSNSAKNKAKEYFLSLLGKAKPSLFMEGIMELGETICVPISPDCERCPLKSHCKAFLEGKQAILPIRKKGNERRKEKKTVVILRQNGGLFYELRQADGILASLYGFPMVEGHLSKAKMKEYLVSKGLSPVSITPLHPYLHRFSHVEWDMKGYLIDLPLDQKKEGFLSTEERKAKFALPTAFLPFEEEIEKEFSR